MINLLLLIVISSVNLCASQEQFVPIESIASPNGSLLALYTGVFYNLINKASNESPAAVSDTQEVNRQEIVCDNYEYFWAIFQDDNCTGEYCYYMLSTCRSGHTVIYRNINLLPSASNEGYYYLKRGKSFVVSTENNNNIDVINVQTGNEHYYYANERKQLSLFYGDGNETFISQFESKFLWKLELSPHYHFTVEHIKISCGNSAQRKKLTMKLRKNKNFYRLVLYVSGAGPRFDASQSFTNASNGLKVYQQLRQSSLDEMDISLLLSKEMKLYGGINLVSGWPNTAIFRFASSDFWSFISHYAKKQKRITFTPLPVTPICELNKSLSVQQGHFQMIDNGTVVDQQAIFIRPEALQHGSNVGALIKEENVQQGTIIMYGNNVPEMRNSTSSPDVPVEIIGYKIIWLLFIVIILFPIILLIILLVVICVIQKRRNPVINRI